ncbi:hypothetical protein [Thetidibacter halocola]|uniref:Uncharacterized protein n=1 Tax=Thetidibacter halocola TaxID=2827239 RepID=A0A8J7WDY6_9RHOB|nr:hypothetical protein [Thetidibacter halocola]MBS0125860.1 hypothetical protein [Thetidibacter halocola]
MIRLALVLSLAAGQAAALSCLPADVVRTYKQVDADDAPWGAAVGRLDFDESRLPVVDWDRQGEVPPETEIRGQMVGHSLTPEGWNRPFQHAVTVRVLCFGPWCPSPRSGATYLAFVKRENGRSIIIADPCGSMLFPNPTQQDMDRLQSCFAGGPCDEGR